MLFEKDDESILAIGLICWVLLCVAFVLCWVLVSFEAMLFDCMDGGQLSKSQIVLEAEDESIAERRSLLVRLNRKQTELEEHLMKNDTNEI